MLDCSRVRDSSWKWSLKDSVNPFCQGEPGSMNAVLIPERRHRSRIACAVDSVPLSILVLAGLAAGLDGHRLQHRRRGTV